MIDQMLARLSGLGAAPPRTDRTRAAVLLAVTEEDEPRLVYTLRSRHMRSHAGEVSFPGGRAEQTDPGPWDTALRESHEEIGLEPGLVRRLCQLTPSVSRFGLDVTPCVGLIAPDLRLRPTSHETEQVFTVPIRALLEGEPLRVDRYQRGGLWVRMPVWKFSGNEIWGLTSMMTSQFLNLAFDAGIRIYDGEGTGEGAENDDEGDKA